MTEQRKFCPGECDKKLRKTFSMAVTPRCKTFFAPACVLSAGEEKKTLKIMGK